MSLSKKVKRNVLHFEIIPIVDVLFTLLIFFVIYATTVTTLNQKGIALQLPKASSTEPVKPKIVISIDQSQQIWIDQQPTSLQTLTAKLTPLASTKPIVIFRADRTIAYDLIVQTLDQVRLAGLTAISLQADAPHSDDIRR